ncbi:outer membrane lipoprotein carrier protein LolA [Pseudooceanicola sp.]|uniref:LolA family protein n=1 Tax=Pseudooceanicola sp. TaxID=1914328 RepID=UPI0026218092|nr:outer membrane lipoprotein carrier protein LolA [Pseudooceanicola sp.]MDF1854592.1 outer membrane lipoprotein carrier protein LolA [Pseudooceanicola sp.]
MKHLALAPALILALALPVAAEKLPLGQISGYLNAMTTAQSKFTQVNDDGSITTGTLYIKRPGRVRFEYDPPEAALVLAGANTVAVFDNNSNTGPTTYPLERTPLSIILAAKVDLNRARMVTGHREDGNTTAVTTQDPAHPEYGSLELVFTGPPVELRQWVITDDSGARTTVILGALDIGLPLSDNLFNIALTESQTGRDQR